MKVISKILQIEKYITRSSGRHWPNGRVPYYLESGFDDNERQQIAKAIVFFEKNTCIRWVSKQNNERSWVLFTRKPNGCYSGVGKENGENKLNLGFGCFQLVVVIHEMLHRIGFIHEQSRPDRDEYVDIFYQNISPCNVYIFNYGCQTYSFHLYNTYFNDFVETKMRKKWV